MTHMDSATVHTASAWDERYSGREPVWSGNANQRLVEQVADLVPGDVLELGCGEGGDAVWLAGQGWTVTATDVSAVAIDKARAHATAVLPADVAARITWQVQDMLTWQPPAASFDLVTLQFLHPKRETLPDLQARLAAAVRPGGRLLIVNHDPEDLHTGVRKHDMPEMMLPAAELAAALDPAMWQVEVAEAQAREFTFPGGDGTPSTVHDAVLRARRL